jgi:hypothetical protein
MVLVNTGFKRTRRTFNSCLIPLQNKPWAALYVACLFLCLFHLCTCFYGIQQVAQAGWSPVLFRVMQELQLFTCRVYIIFILLIMCGLHFNLFVWLDPEVVKR